MDLARDIFLYFEGLISLSVTYGSLGCFFPGCQGLLSKMSVKKLLKCVKTQSKLVIVLARLGYEDKGLIKGVIN